MGNNITVGSFNLDHTLTTQAITGVGFKPTAIIFFALNSAYTWTPGTAFDPTYHGGVCYGFAANDGNQASIMTAMQDGSDNGAKHRQYSQSYALFRRPSASYTGMCNEAAWWGALDGAFTVQSFDTSGFTIYNDVDFGCDWVNISYIAIKAPNASILHKEVPSSTGNASFTGAGFRPDAMFSLYSRVASPSYAADALGGIGFTDGVTAACIEAYSQNSQSWSQCWHSGNDDEFICSGIADRAQIVSLDSDGATLNWVEVSNAGDDFSVLCLGGIEAYVGTFQSKTDTSEYSVTTIGFEPQGIIFINSNGHNTANGSANDYYQSFGATSGPSESNCMSVIEIFNWRPPTITESWHNDRAFDQISNATIDGEMELVSFNSDGFTYKWSDADSGAADIFYIALRVLRVEYRDQLVKYIHNTYESRRAGRPVIKDNIGRVLPSEQLEVDNWIFSGGFGFPTPEKFDSLLEDPYTFYAETIDAAGNDLSIGTDRESFLESLIRKMGRG